MGNFKNKKHYHPSWVKKRHTSPSSSLVTSTLENPPPPVISSTNAVVLMREPLPSSRRKPKKWVKLLSNTPGYLINLRPREKEVSLSISLSGSSSLLPPSTPSLMLQDIEISLRT